MGDRAVVDFGEWLGEQLATVVGSPLVGVYLHGSAALGGFRPGASDLDVLVVVEGHLQSPECRDITRVVQESHRPTLGRGIETSVILGEVARSGGRRTDFEVHVTTDPNHAKVVYGADHPGDPDLILHMAVCRQSGIAAVGRNPAAVFAEVGPGRVIGQLINELTWAIERDSEAYAVLNACRALFYLENRKFCSKLDGGRWTRRQLGSSSLIERSLAVQQGRTNDRPPSPQCETFIADAISALTSALSELPMD